MDYLSIIRKNHQALAAQQFAERTTVKRHFSQEKQGLGSLADVLALPSGVLPKYQNDDGSFPYTVDFGPVDTVPIL